MSAGPVSPAKPGAIDRMADFLVAVAARKRDSEGRAVIAWEWKENGRTKRWDAALDAAQQRRLGRALLALAAAPLALIVLVFAAGDAFGLGLLLVLPPAIWGAVSVRRLYRETNDPGRAPS